MTLCLSIRLAVNCHPDDRLIVISTDRRERRNLPGVPCRSLGYGLRPPLGMTIEAAPVSPGMTMTLCLSIRLAVNCHPDDRLIVILTCCHSIRLIVISTDRRERRNLPGVPCRSLGFGLRPPLGMTIEAAPASPASRGWSASSCSPDWFPSVAPLSRKAWPFVISTARLASHPDDSLIVISTCCHSVRLIVISTDRRERRNLPEAPCRSLGYGLRPPLGMIIEASPVSLGMTCQVDIFADGQNISRFAGNKERARPCGMGLHSGPPRQKKL